MMSTASTVIANNHKIIIAALVLVILFFLTACIFHDVIPICHWVFGCDHRMH